MKKDLKKKYLYNYNVNLTIYSFCYANSQKEAKEMIKKEFKRPVKDYLDNNNIHITQVLDNQDYTVEKDGSRILAEIYKEYQMGD